MGVRNIFAVEVHVRSPFSFAAVEASGIGIDTPFLRDEDKKPILPADHFKGLLREGFEAIEGKSTALVNGFKSLGLFGDEAKDFLPNRGELLFADLRLADGASERTITRIEIDDKTGSVEAGMLQVVELALPLAKTGVFKGELLWHGAEDQARKLAPVLEKALRLVPYFGGMRTAGFGEHVRKESSIKFKPSKPPGAAAFPVAAGERYEVEASFDRPFAVAVEAVAGNVFLGGEVVPGGAIKGAIGDMLKAAGHDQWSNAMLAAMRVSHAFPVVDGQIRSRALPLSTAFFADGENKWFRCELTNSGDGVDGKLCADFLPDMKADVIEALAMRIGRPPADLDQDARGHTEIESKTGSPVQGRLYVVIGRKAKGVPFRFTVDFPVAPFDAKEAGLIMALLQGGLDRLGKTGARFTPGPPKPVKPPGLRQAHNGCWRVLLETPAVFILPDEGASQQTAEEMFEQYFGKVLIGAKPLDYFCRRKLAGGYQVERHRQGRRYRPYAVFEAGSCFVFKDAPGMDAKLQELERRGLPVYRRNGSGVLHEETDWRTCPYLPQNGYGEFSVEPDVFDKIGGPA